MKVSAMGGKARLCEVHCKVELTLGKVRLSVDKVRLCEG